MPGGEFDLPESTFSKFGINSHFPALVLNPFQPLHFLRFKNFIWKRQRIKDINALFYDNTIKHNNGYSNWKWEQFIPQSEWREIVDQVTYNPNAEGEFLRWNDTNRKPLARRLCKFLLVMLCSAVRKAAGQDKSMGYYHLTVFCSRRAEVLNERTQCKHGQTDSNSKALKPCFSCGGSHLRATCKLRNSK